MEKQEGKRGHERKPAGICWGHTGCGIKIELLQLRGCAWWTTEISSSVIKRRTRQRPEPERDVRQVWEPLGKADGSHGPSLGCLGQGVMDWQPSLNANIAAIIFRWRWWRIIHSFMTLHVCSSVHLHASSQIQRNSAKNLRKGGKPVDQISRANLLKR